MADSYPARTGFSLALLDSVGEGVLTWLGYLKPDESPRFESALVVISACGIIIGPGVKREWGFNG